MAQSDKNAPIQSNQSRNPFPPLSQEWWRFWELLYGEDLEGSLDPDLAWGPDPLPLSEGCLRLIEVREQSSRKRMTSAGTHGKASRKRGRK